MSAVPKRKYTAAEYLALERAASHKSQFSATAVCERFVRRADGSWAVAWFVGPDATLAFATVTASVPLADLYARVEFPEGMANFVSPAGRKKAGTMAASPPRSEVARHSVEIGRPGSPAGMPRVVTGLEPFCQSAGK